jgi:hypothetical protein
MPDDPRSSPLWPADNPGVIAHINLLQGIINRLANNSAGCKTWCITLVAALLALAGATRAPAIVAFALIPVVVFGFLDSMYLAQERAYRGLYGRIVAAVRNGSYSRENVFDARAPIGGAGRVWSAFWSWAVWPVYLGLIVAYIIAALTGALAGLARG